MLIISANLRRKGERLRVPADELVPGDIFSRATIELGKSILRHAHKGAIT
jgi:hypothetical protein